MDKTPSSSVTKRAPKRPHSPQDDRSSPVESKIPAAEPQNFLESDTKRDKLLRLLGGKKRKNETAASKWLERVRSREDELKVSTELESQFNESLTHKLSGHARRHTGIGFVPESPDLVKKTEPIDTAAETSSTPCAPDTGSKPTSEDRTVDIQKTNTAGRHVFSEPAKQATFCPASSHPGPAYQGYRHPAQPPRPYYGYGGASQNGAVGSPVQYDYRNIQSGGYTYGGQGYHGNYQAGNLLGAVRGHHNPGYQTNNPPPGDRGHYNPGHRDSKPQESPDVAPKSKSSFYAQFKKAS